MSVAVVPFVIGAVLSWIVVVVSGLRMFFHRAEHVSVAYLAGNGLAFFEPGNFLPEAAADGLRFRIAFVAFFVFVLLAAGVGVWFATAAPAP